MTNKTYKMLEQAKIIRSYKCKKEDYEAADEMLRVSDNPGLDGYKLYEEIEDENELKLLLMATEVRNTHSIRTMLIYFTTISVIGLIAWFIWQISISSAN
jgi:hypothetical protein